MVGGRTLHAEDPRLTVRSAELQRQRLDRGESRQPAKVAVTASFRLPPDCRFLTVGPARVILLVPDDSQPHVEGAEVHTCRDLREGMHTLARLGIRRVLAEGGGTLNFDLFRLELVNELQLYLAPLVFGGATAPTLADGAGLPRDLAVRLLPPEVHADADGGLVLRYMVKRS
jgi:2,5-diamino-6-(ribosylamino)-4(3H)-pyrimidinone 5'-phosphate reductase